MNATLQDRDSDDESPEEDRGPVAITPRTWMCYDSLLPKLEKLKQASLKFESQSQVTISKVFRGFVGLLYDARAGLNVAHDDVSVPDDLKLFCSAFRKKLLNLMDDTEQVFLWATAAMLDGRIKTTKFAQCIWSREYRHEWPSVVGLWTSRKRLDEHVAREIIHMVREMPMSRHCFGE